MQSARTIGKSPRAVCLFYLWYFQRLCFCRAKFKIQFSFKVEIKKNFPILPQGSLEEILLNYMYQIATFFSWCWLVLINTIKVLVIAREFAFVRSRLQAKARLQLQVSNGQLDPSVFMLLLYLTLSFKICIQWQVIPYKISWNIHSQNYRVLIFGNLFYPKAFSCRAGISILSCFCI